MRFQFSYLRQNERAEKERQIQNRREEKPASVDGLLRFEETHRDKNKEAVEDELDREINRAHHAEELRHARNKEQENAKEDALARASGAGVVLLRDHLEPGACV